MGYYSAAVVAALEERVGVPLAQRFDLIVGTSVGGIIALALARGVPAAKIVDIFAGRGGEVFAPHPPPQTAWQLLRELRKNSNRPKYDGKRLRKILGEVVGERSTLADLKHSVLLSSVSLNDCSPFYFGSTDMPGCERLGKVRLVDAAMATSAVPGYFPLVSVDGLGLFADGGLFAAQPDLQALQAAQARFGKPPVGKLPIMVSIGTASAVFEEMATAKTYIGNLGWVKQQRLLKVALASQQRATVAAMRTLLGNKNYIRLDERQSLAEQKLVGVDAANPTAKRILEELAAKTVRSIPPSLKKLLG